MQNQCRLGHNTDTGTGYLYLYLQVWRVYGATVYLYLQVLTVLQVTCGLPVYLCTCVPIDYLQVTYQENGVKMIIDYILRPIIIDIQ
jgi:hypothetical protein